MCLAGSLTPDGFLSILLMESLSLLEGALPSSASWPPRADYRVFGPASDEEILLGENDTCEIIRHLDHVDQGSVHQPLLYLGRLRQHSLSQECISNDRTYDNLETTSLDRVVASGDGAIDWSTSDSLKGLNTVRLAAARNLARLDMV
jgi:hypothetical protein